MTAHNELEDAIDNRVRELLSLWSDTLTRATTAGQFLQALTDLNLEWHLMVEGAGVSVEMTEFVAPLVIRGRQHG